MEKESNKRDFLDELLEEVKKDLERQKLEAEKILDDMTKDPSLLDRWLK